DAGARLHLVLAPATADALDPWYRLGFGQMHLHAIRESGGAEPVLPAGATIRAAQRDDLERVARELGMLVLEHQALSPTFTGARAPDPDELLADWMQTFDDPSDALCL